jgi:hypothetical protein
VGITTAPTFFFFFTAPKAHNDRLNNTTEKLSFQIVGKRKVLLVLIARTQQDKDNWMRELNNVLNTEDSAKSGGTPLPPLPRHSHHG